MASGHTTTIRSITFRTAGGTPVWVWIAGVFSCSPGWPLWLIDLKSTVRTRVNTLQFMVDGFGPLLGIVLYYWYYKVIEENEQGLVNAQLKRSYVWGMGWFIFSEVMFFAAFFGALFYTRVLAVAPGSGVKAVRRLRVNTCGRNLRPNGPLCRTRTMRCSRARHRAWKPRA